MTPVLRQRAAFELGEDQVAVRADDVFEHADDVGLELLDVGAVEDGPADADHAGTDLVDAHLRGRAVGHGRDEDDQAANQAQKQGGELAWVSDPIYGRSRLLVKEKWPIVLTRLPSFAIVTAPDAEVL